MGNNSIGRRLLSFPVPAEGECLYSIFVRYHKKSANRNSDYTSLELFGSRINLRYTVALPYCIERADAWISPRCGITMRTIQRRNTAQGYLQMSGIFPDGSFEKLTKARQVPGRGWIHRMLEVAHGGKQGLYFCPQCAKEDALQIGEPYWHLSHQLLGVEYCPEHGELLQAIKPSQYEMSRRYLAVSDIMPGDIDKRDTAPLRKYRHQFIELGKTIAEMVNQSMDTDYRELMCLYERERPNFDMHKMVRLIESYGGKDFIAALYPGEKYDNLIDEVTKKGPAAIPPVIHALLITALDLREDKLEGSTKRRHSQR